MVEILGEEGVSLPVDYVNMVQVNIEGDSWDLLTDSMWNCPQGKYYYIDKANIGDERTYTYHCNSTIDSAIDITCSKVPSE